jgi:Repeat of unknown function (DUF346)
MASATDVAAAATGVAALVTAWMAWETRWRNGWSGWTQKVPGTWTQGAVATSSSSGRVDAFVVDASTNALAHAWWDGTTWRSEVLDGTLTSKPAAGDFDAAAFSFAPDRVNLLADSKFDE